MIKKFDTESFIQNIPSSKCEIYFALVSFSAIFLQKIGFSIAGGTIALDTIILLLIITYMLVKKTAYIVFRRLQIFIFLFLFTIISVVISGNYTGVSSLFIFVLLYSFLLVRVDVNQATLFRCFRYFRTGMTTVSAIVILQQVMQYSIGNQYWINLDKILPSFILINGYAYLRPYAWNSPYLVPNGIFFLEPSVLSQFTAVALALEIVLYKKLLRLCLFATALLAGVAGSGPVAIVLCTPWLIFRMGSRLVVLASCFSVLLLVGSIMSGAFSHFLDRSNEFTDDTSSGYARIVTPLTNTLDLAEDAEFFFKGEGPGSSPKGDNQVQWPSNKLTFEYGLVTAVIFHVFFLVSTLGSAPVRAIMPVIIIPYLFFGGGLLSHANVMLLVMFGSLLRLPQPILANHK